MNAIINSIELTKYSWLRQAEGAEVIDLFYSKFIQYLITIRYAIGFAISSRHFFCTYGPTVIFFRLQYNCVSLQPCVMSPNQPLIQES